MPRDFSQLSKPLMFISGNKDGLLPPKRLAGSKNNLPAKTIYKEIDGGNHKNFALYSHQFFDGEATIAHEQQIDQANALTLAFFQGL
jgi:predicted dienelactone hydrolase